MFRRIGREVALHLSSGPRVPISVTTRLPLALRIDTRAREMARRFRDAKGTQVQ